jgi:phage tail sheath protein FI
MPEYLAPGVYVEETSFRAKSIEGVSTTTTGFVGPTRYGPISDTPEVVTSLGEFERVYGDRQKLVFSDGEVDNYLWHAVRAFFAEGGKRLYVSRIFRAASGTNDGRAFGFLPSNASAGSAAAVTFRSRFPGETGNRQVRLRLEFGANLLTSKNNTASVTGIGENDLVWISDAAANPAAPPAPVAGPPDPGKDLPLALKTGVFDPLVVLENRLKDESHRLAEKTIAIYESRAAVRAFEKQARAADRLAKENHAERMNLLQATLGSLADRGRRANLDAEDAGNTLKVVRTAIQTAIQTAIGAANTPATAAETAAVEKLQSDTFAPITAIGEAKTSSDALNALLTVIEAGAAARTKAVEDAAQAAKDADAAAKTAMKEAAAISAALRAKFFSAPLPGAGKSPVSVRTGRLYIARRLTDGTTQFVAGPNDKRTETELDPATNEVRLVTMSVAAARPDGEFEVWGGLHLDRNHVRGGTPDSFAATFPEVNASAGKAATLGLVVEQGRSLSDAIKLVEALFGGSTPALQANADIEFDPLRPDQYEVVLPLAGGNDGARPTGTDYEGVTGADDAKTGLKLLEDIEDVSIVAAPGSTYVPAGSNFAIQAQTAVNALIRHCQLMKYRIAVLDSTNDHSVSDVLAFRGKLDSTYAALYYPWVTVLDPVSNTEINLPPSGFVAGIYARNDVNRAVYKAPANEVVTLALGFEKTINKAQQEILNPQGVNCFRYFEGRGYRLWGARTISSDPEWKYVNLRRYFAYLERSIDKSTQFAVFEPNGEALWANIRRMVEDFLFSEWQSGALLGDKPEKAFFVRCDRSTMNQNDLDNGRLVCQIGVAPLRPAEFVIFRIGQFTADRR